MCTSWKPQNPHAQAHWRKAFQMWPVQFCFNSIQSPQAPHDKQAQTNAEVKKQAAKEVLQEKKSHAILTFMTMVTMLIHYDTFIIIVIIRG